MKKYLAITSYLIILLSFLFIYGCQSTGSSSAADSSAQSYTRDGKTYGVTEGSFRHRWWNYFERALSFADGKFWPEAEKDLREAITKRKDDKRRARTYGMHFVDYFPHRELGIVLYNQGRLEEALQELEISLASEKSAKGEIYIDRVRKALIEQKQFDKTPPVISISSPKAESLHNTFSVKVTGTVTDDTYVRQITVNGTEVRQGVSNKEQSFQLELPVSAGKNSILVIAEDLAGRTSQANVDINVDLSGPTIRLDELSKPDSSGQVQVSVTAYDASGISDYSIEGNKISHDGTQQASFQQSVSIAPSQKSIAVEVKDLAGNVTKAEIEINDAENLAQRTSKSSANDKTPPVIIIRNLEDGHVTYSDQIFIEGSAKDSSDVEQIFINDLQILKNPAPKAFFSHLTSLQEGENSIIVKAVDSSGNSSVKNLTVKREILNVKKTGARLQVAVNQFEKKVIGQDQGLSFGFEDLLTTSILKRSRFKAIDRRNLKKVLDELKINQSGLVAEKDALKAGKILSADGMLIGYTLERQDSIEIYVQFIDTETAEIIAAADVYGEEIDRDTLDLLSKGMSLKLADELPVAEGMVVSSDGSELIIDLSEQDRVKSGMKVIIYKVGKPVVHPKTGKVIGLGIKELGRARLKSVMNEMSYVELDDRNSAKSIEAEHYVITR